MNLTVLPRLTKQAERLPRSTQVQLAQALRSIQAADSFVDIPNFRNLEGYRNYYRVRIGQYRLGLYWDGVTFFAESIGIRGDFYKTYPPR